MKKYLYLLLISVPVALTGCSHRTEVVYAPPPAYSEVARQAYHDGIAAAQRDMRDGLRPDVDRHQRFRNPPTPPGLMDDYRNGFREGYRAVFHGGPGPGY
jgi:hypothetical protein